MILYQLNCESLSGKGLYPVIASRGLSWDGIVWDFTWTQYTAYNRQIVIQHQLPKSQLKNMNVKISN